MIKVIRKKFIMTAMISVTVLIFFLISAINIANIVILNGRSERTLQVIYERVTVENHNQQLPPTENLTFSFYNQKIISPNNMPFISNYYIVYFDNDGKILYTNAKNMPSIDEDYAKETANNILMTEKDSGTFEYFRYMVANHSNGKAVICIDISKDTQSFLSVLFISVTIGAICWIIMLIFVVLLSKRTVHPIAEAFDKQNQFITNAGHELKTPIAIIQSNAEAMELYKGQNKWIINIKEQTLRLSELAKGLLFLSRMDEKQENNKLEKIDLSSLLNKVFSNFNHQLEKKKVHNHIFIDENIEIINNYSLIEQLLYILIDNAVKYVSQGGSVILRLSENQNNVFFSIENTCDKLPAVPPDKLFDRFYKGDKSRNQKGGGYGIGLSIASSIVSAIRSDIKATYVGNNTVKFTVIFY